MFTLFHVVVSLVGIVAGPLVAAGLLGRQTLVPRAGRARGGRGGGAVRSGGGRRGKGGPGRKPPAPPEGTRGCARSASRDKVSRIYCDDVPALVRAGAQP